MKYVGRNVWILGLTSLLTDASSEMVAAILPLYALYFLHTSPAIFGVVDGLQQGGASIVKLAAGWLTDRSQRHKSIAAAGYTASALSKLGLLMAAGGALTLTLLVALDRVGKGIRTAPRDAIISLSVPRGALASAFGIHRALDTTGAMLGPLLAFLVLRWIADGYDVVFVVSLATALVGVAALVLFVDTSVVTGTAAEEAPPSHLRWASARFVSLAVLAGVFGLATISDAFIYLSLQRQVAFDAGYVPLLFVATPAVYLTLAIPVGRIADRVGRPAVIIGGYSALLALYVMLSSGASSQVTVALCVLLLGSFYAMTDGVFAALASSELPAARRATGLAIVSTCNDAGRLVSSVLFGWLWSRSSPVAAARSFIPLLVVALVVLDPGDMAISNQRALMFVAILVLSTVGVASYVQWRQRARTAATPGAAPSLDLNDPAVSARLAQLRAAPHVVYLSRRTDSFDQVGLAPLATPDDRMLLATPSCERSHFGAKTGLCLVINRESMSPRAYAVFVDGAFEPIRRLPLDGLPIRARVSPDNRWAAATVFVSGESYVGDFTTRTSLFNLEDGTIIDNLETFTTERNGKVIKEVDFNFWGVTFFPSGDRFLATLGTGGRRFLVEGDIARRRLTVLHDDVECPSLSPDATRIVFKRAAAMKGAWRLWVMRLDSGEAWPVTDEDRYIDDQAEWLDNDRVLYGLLYGEGIPENALSIWVSAVSRESAFDASIFVRAASSPSVVR